MSDFIRVVLIVVLMNLMSFAGLAGVIDNSLVLILSYAVALFPASFVSTKETGSKVMTALLAVFVVNTITLGALMSFISHGLQFSIDGTWNDGFPFAHTSNFTVITIALVCVLLSLGTKTQFKPNWDLVMILIFSCVSALIFGIWKVSGLKFWDLSGVWGHAQTHWQWYSFKGQFVINHVFILVTLGITIDILRRWHQKSKH